MGSGVPCTRNTRQGGSLPHTNHGTITVREAIRAVPYIQISSDIRLSCLAQGMLYLPEDTPPPRKSLSKTKWLRHRSPMRGIGDSWLHTGHLAAHLGGWGSNSIHQTTSLWELGNSTCEVSPQKTTSRMHPGFHTCSIKHGPFMGFWVPIVKDRVEPQ